MIIFTHNKAQFATHGGSNNHWNWRNDPTLALAFVGVKAENMKMHQRPQLYDHDSISPSMVASWCHIWLVRMVLREVLQQPLIQYFLSSILRHGTHDLKLEALSMLSDIQYTSGQYKLECHGLQGWRRELGQSDYIWCWDQVQQRDMEGGMNLEILKGLVQWASNFQAIRRGRFFEKNYNPLAQLIGCWSSVGVGLPLALSR